MKKDLQIIIRERKNRKNRSSDPIIFFLDKYFDADDLLKRINKKIKTKRLNQEARKQYIISLVTAFEVYLKDSFVRLIDEEKLDYSGLIEGFNRKFNLEEVLFIRREKISTGELLSSQFNFQDLGDIEKAFSKLLGKNFFQELKNYKFYFNGRKGDFIQLKKNFYTKLQKLLDLRHSLVHDINFKDFMRLRYINSLSTNLLMFVNMMEFFIEDFLDTKK